MRGVDRYVDVLRRAKLRVTPQRIAILDALARGAHLETCQAIWRRAHRRARGLGLVTVYRILERLRTSGVVAQIDLRGATHFCLADHHHDHVICERCGRVEPLEPCVLPSLAGLRLPGSGFLVNGHRLDLLGVCRRCQRAPAAETVRPPRLPSPRAAAPRPTAARQ